MFIASITDDILAIFRHETQTMRPALLVLNSLISLASAGWAVVALVQPAFLSGSGHVSGGERFYSRMYAVRSIPFGLATAIAPFCTGGTAIAWLLFTAAGIQITDAIIGAEKKARGMMIGASLAALIHVLCGWAVS